MAIITTFTFTSDTESVTRTKLNNLNANLVTEFNGNITNANIGASAAIAASKLDLSSISQTMAISGATTFSGNTLIGTANQGDILYDNGTTLTRLTPGTTGKFLRTQGASANPTWSYCIPIGGILIWTTTSAPSDFLLCDGSAVSRTTYATLFGIISTTYGSGDGSTTFNVPNLKGKVVVGLNASETEFDTIGETGGAKTVTLDTTMIPAHTHQILGAGNGGGGGSNVNTEANGSYPGFGSPNTQSTGGGAAHANLQPYISLPFIIRYQ